MSPPRVIGYLRVSTIEQQQSGAGLSAQRKTIQDEWDRRGVHGEWVVDAGVSGAVPPNRRTGLGSALAGLDGGQFGAIFVSRLDRLGRSLQDVAALLDRAERQRWSIVSCDTSGLDLSSATGRLVGGVLASAAAFERDLARQRTREGLAAKRAQGVRLGRPPVLDEQTLTFIRTCRERGMSLRAIAAALDETGIATAHGAEGWHPFSVAKALKRADATQAHAVSSVPTSLNTAPRGTDVQ